MKFRSILPVAAAALAFVSSSCTPWVEPGPPPPTPQGDPAMRRNADDQPPLTPEEQARLKEKREEKKREAAEKMRNDTDTDGQTAGPGGDSGPDRDGVTPPPPRKEKESAAPTAMKVPGRPGMVFSPFNNKIVDVSGIPSGRLVADPTYPSSEKKHFRVP